MIRALFDLIVLAGMVCLVLGVIGYLAAEAKQQDK